MSTAKRYKWLWVAAVVLHVVVLGLCLETVPKTNPASRYATIDSLVHRGTYAIDDSRYIRTLDKVYLDGHFLSSKPPLLSTVGAGVYGLYTTVTGWTLDSHEVRTVGFMSYMMGVVPHLALLCLYAGFLQSWVTSFPARILGLLAFALGYFGVGYAVCLNNHTPAGLCVFLAFVQMVRIRRGQEGTASWLLGGLAAGLAPAMDIGAAVFSAAFALVLLFSDWRKTLRLFVPAAAAPLLVHFALTFYATGFLLPLYGRPELYIYPGSRWAELIAAHRESVDVVARLGMDGLREPRWFYALHVLVGHHGIFAMTPLFVLSLWAMLYHAFRDRGRRMISICVLLASALVLAVYIKRTYNYGGRCFGFRWFVFAMPVWFAFVPLWWEDIRFRGRSVVLAICLIVSILTAVDALQGCWRPSEWNMMLRKAGMGSLPASWDKGR
jgi:hypothetical protein